MLRGMARTRKGAATAAPAGAGSVEAVISALTVALEARDGYTSEHSSATIGLTQAVGRRLGLGRDALPSPTTCPPAFAAPTA